MIIKPMYSGLLMIALSGACVQSRESSPSQKAIVERKDVTVYTTADSSEKRLTKTATLIIDDTKQPLETDVSVFVNSEKQFQTVLGFGGAITDASAEVFA